MSELLNAVNKANNSSGNVIILLEDGIYTLPETIYVNSPNVTIASRSGNREKVVIQGDAMSSSAKIGNIIKVAGKNFEIRGLTLQKCGWHLIQVTGENNADFPIVRNCILMDSYQQMLKITLDPNNPNVTSDYGLVENCLFEYSSTIGPQYYIGGIDAHGAKNWIVRNNIFRNIISPSITVAEFAIHFWNGSANNLIEKNLILNCDRGIGFGMEGRGNSGGIIRNNMIYHASNKGQYADVGIALLESPDTQVYNNTIFMENNFPWAIEYRFSTTRNILIANNLTNKPIVNRDNASGYIINNNTNALPSWFKNFLTGDLHLSSAIDSVVDSGIIISGLEDDFDGQPRPQAGGIDIGADEYIINAVPSPPKNLRIINQ